MGSTHQLVVDASQFARLGSKEIISTMLNYLSNIPLGAAIKGLSGDTNGAKIDCDAILREDPNHLNALYNRIIIARLDNDTDYILTLTPKLPKELFKQDVQIIHLVVSAYIEKKMYEDALKLVDNYEGTYKNLADNYECLVIKAWVLFMMGKNQQAMDLIASLVDKPTNPVLALENAALFENLTGSINHAINYLQEAFEKAAEGERQDIALKLASLYIQQADFPNTIDWLDKGNIDITTNLKMVKQFMPAFMASFQYEKAYNYCRAFRDKNIDDMLLIEVEANIAELLGDLQLAYELDSKLCILDPDQPKHQINKARIHMRRGDLEGAKTTLKEINVTKVQHAFLLLQLAQIHMLTNNPKQALEIAYLARQLGINAQEIHQGYISVFLYVEDEIKDLEPTEVSVQTSVLLSNIDEERWVTISTEKNTNEEAWEVSENSEIAKLLLGHKKGKTVEPSTNLHCGNSWVIKEIQSIYVRALQQTFSEFNMRFPESNSFRKIRIEGENLIPFLTTVAGMSTKTQQTLEHYKTGQFTVEQLSAMTGHNRFDTFLGLMATENNGPYASRGTHNDQFNQLRTVSGSKEITVDLTALITSDYLDILRLLPKRFAKIYVPHHLIDELNEILYKRRYELKKGYKTIGYNGNNFFFEEIPQEQIVNSINKITEIKEFVEKYCTITPISPSYANQMAQFAKDEGRNGLSSISTIIIAQQTRTAVYADDFQFRNIASGFLGVSGFWSQELLKDLVSRRFITQTEYNEACAKLLVSGYFYTSVDLTLTYQTLEKHNFETNRYTLAVINALKGPSTIESNAINISADAIGELWTRPAPIEFKINMLDNFLRAITAGRNTDIVLIKLKAKIMANFGLEDFQKNQIVKNINLWDAVTRKTLKG